MPATLGYKVAVRIDELCRHVERCARRAAAVRQGKPFGAVLAGDARVTAHMTPEQIGRLLDPIAYAGLCTCMAHEGAARARALAEELGRDG